MDAVWTLFGVSSDNNWRRESQENFGTLDMSAEVVLTLPAGKENRIANVVVDLFSSLKETSEMVLKGRLQAIQKRGGKPDIIKSVKNRYKDVFPTSVDLVYLQDASYINANRFGRMIVTQGPFIRNGVNTVKDLWKLAFQQGNHLICLTDAYAMEGLELVEKSFPYWEPRLELGPNICYKDEGEDNLEVKLLDKPLIVVEPKNGKGEFVTRRLFSIQWGEQKKEITHWHFEKWVDRSVCDPVQLAQLVFLLLQAGGLPILHCSAGIGRAGVLAILLKLMPMYLENKKIPTAEDIDEAIADLRKRRPGSVQNINQLDLISKTIMAFIELYSKF